MIDFLLLYLYCCVWVSSPVRQQTRRRSFSRTPRAPRFHNPQASGEKAD